MKNNKNKQKCETYWQTIEQRYYQSIPSQSSGCEYQSPNFQTIAIKVTKLKQIRFKSL